MGIANNAFNDKSGHLILIAIAWMYVVLMMSVAEATSSQGTVLGAIVTFVLYGVAPLSLVMYLVGTPARRRGRQQREAAAETAASSEAATEAATEAAPKPPAANPEL